MHAFSATIYKTGINAAVDVPQDITGKLKPDKGYIKVQGTINSFNFETTLVPVKNGPYRLFVNILMLNGAKAALGDIVTFRIKQVPRLPLETEFPTPPLLAQKLTENGLNEAFNTLSPSRRKEVLRYLGFIKNHDILVKNVDKFVTRLKENAKTARIP
jgi:hypothetical protein